MLENNAFALLFERLQGFIDCFFQVIRRGDRRPFYAPARYVMEVKTDQARLQVGETPEWALDRFTKKLFWNFKECQQVSMKACLAEQMSEKNFFPNVAPSLGSGIFFFGGIGSNW